MAELQVHGGRAVIAGVLAALGAHRGLPAGGARRVRAPRLRERQARPHWRRGPRRPGRCGDGSAAAPGAAPGGRRALSRLRGLAAAAGGGNGAAGGGDRFLRRARCGRRHLEEGARRGGGSGARHRGASRRRPSRRAAARGLPRGAGGAAQRRQVEPAQLACPPRGGDRVGGGRHHPRRDRGEARPRGPAGDRQRHRRPARGPGGGGQDRAGGHAAHGGPRARSGPDPLADRHHGAAGHGAGRDRRQGRPHPGARQQDGPAAERAFCIRCPPVPSASRF